MESKGIDRTCHLTPNPGGYHAQADVSVSYGVCSLINMRSHQSGGTVHVTKALQNCFFIIVIFI